MCIRDREKEEPNAAVFSKCDLSVNGSGSLEINANFNNGLSSKDELRILGGDIKITSEDDAVMGRDLVSISGGNLNLNAGGDGIKSTNEDVYKRQVLC